MLFANNANTTLNGGITAIATSMVVTSATGFPSPTGSQYFYCTLADAATQTTIEIVKVTAVSGTTFTIVRGQDGTTGTIFASGAVVSLRLVAASLNDFPKLDEVNTFTGLITASGGVAGALNGTVGATTPSTGKFTSVTNTGLTSGRVVYVTTGGLETDSANLTYSGTSLSVNGTTSTAYIATADNGYGLFQGSTNSSGARISIAGGDATNGISIWGYNSNSTDYTPLNYGASLHIFKIGSTERIRLDANGLLGIGLTPTGTTIKLQVSGDALISGLTVGKGGGAVTSNTAIGQFALLATNTGTGANTAVGYQSGYSNTSGAYNVAVGYNALYSNSTTNNNTGIGYAALAFNTASNNTAVGYQAGYTQAGASTGNSYYGYQSGYGVTTGTYNVIIGSYQGSTAPISATGSNFIVLSDGAGNIGASWAGATGNMTNTGTITATAFSGPLNGTVGATTPNTIVATQLTVNGSNLNTAISPTGTGTVNISPAGALTINPTAASTINNASIGATTASTGAFTTLSASSTVSGTGFSTYLASPPAIGGTAAAAGSFTSITATSVGTAGVLAKTGGKTAVTGVAGSLTLGTGGVTLASQTMATGSTWRVRAYGTYVASSSATSRTLTMSCFWNNTALTAVTTGNVLASTAQTTPWQVEIEITGSSASAAWCTAVLMSQVTSATIPQQYVATAASVTGLTNPQTLDFRVGQTGTAVAGDTINVHSVTIERIV